MFTALWLLSGGSESPSIDEKFGLVFGVRKIKYNKFNHKYKQRSNTCEEKYKDDTHDCLANQKQSYAFNHLQ